MTTRAAALFHYCVVDRDEASWSRLLSEYGQRIRNVLLSEVRRNSLLVDGAVDLDDLVQDLFGRMLLTDVVNISHWGEGQVWNYLRTVARSVVVDHLRMRRATKRGCERLCIDIETRGGLEGIASQSPDPEQLTLARERRQVVLRLAKRTLGRGGCELELRIVKLVLIDGLTSVEAAIRIAHRRTPGQIDWLIHRLRRGFASRGIELPRRNGSRPSTIGVPAA